MICVNPLQAVGFALASVLLALGRPHPLQAVLICVLGLMSGEAVDLAFLASDLAIRCIGALDARIFFAQGVLRAVRGPESLRRAIGVVSKGTWGGWIKIGVKKPAQMKEFYPAFLFYGVRKQGKIQRLAPGEGRGASNRRARGERAALIAERRSNTGFFVAPRNNYMVDALEAKRGIVKQIIQDALKNALVPR